MTLKRLGVVGAGPMGAGIAQVGLAAGMEVILFDLDAGAAKKAADSIDGHLTRMEEKGKLEAGFAAVARRRLLLASDLAQLAPCDLVIEAVVERLDVKQKVFAALEGVVAKDAVLATNTSSLSVAEIARHCTHKERVCGLHFFNPVPLMRLVEVIVAPATSDAVAELAARWVVHIGKVPVTVKDAPGFLVNLQGRAYALEALAIAQERVAEPAVIDRILRDAAGFRMGPFELMDLTGIDVNYAASTFIYEGYQHDPRLRTTTLHASMAASGRFGRKSGQGFYDYAAGATTAATPAATKAPTPFRVRLVESNDALEALARTLDAGTGDEVVLIAPVGEDCATACSRLGLDPARTVAIDLTGLDANHLTVMAAVGGRALTEPVGDALRAKGFTVEAIADSPGFVLQRVLAMIANLGCELAQIGVASPDDIDLAMKLAQNYPKGPIEFADWLGVEKTHAIMRQLQAITGSDRYRPSLWLRRRALLGLSAREIG